MHNCRRALWSRQGTDVEVEEGLLLWPCRTAQIWAGECVIEQGSNAEMLKKVGVLAPRLLGTILWRIVGGAQGRCALWKSNGTWQRAGVKEKWCRGCNSAVAAHLIDGQLDKESLCSAFQAHSCWRWGIREHWRRRMNRLLLLGRWCCGSLT